MGLDIDITKLAGPGRRKLPLEATVTREISTADLGLLATMDRGSESGELKKIGERHHMVARLLAAGTPPGEVAACTGFSASRISILQNSPAMKELIALYQKEVNAQFSQVLDHMAGLSTDAILTLRERLEENPDDFSVKELIGVAELTLDRTGHGKTSTVNQNVNVNLAARLENARQRAKQLARGDVIEGEIIPDA